MKIFDVVVLTEDQYINPKEKNAYINNVLLEDKLVIDALLKKGLHVIKKSWSDQNFNWSSAKYLLFRTTWDYQNRHQEFFDWLKKIKGPKIQK